MENNRSASGGIGFTGLLTIAFIVLKLCNVINWSWWWVISPIWISLGIFIVGLIGIWAYWQWRARDERKRIASGVNKWAWKRRNKKNKPDQITQPPLSKWEERLQEMKKRKEQP